MSPPKMANTFIALFLLVYGANLLFGLSIPPAVPGTFAVVAGVILLTQCYRLRVDRKRDGELGG